MSGTSAAAAAPGTALSTESSVLVKFVASADTVMEDGSAPVAPPMISIPLGVSHEQLNHLLNKLLDNDEALPYSFYVDQDEIIGTLQQVVEKQGLTTEEAVTVLYQPQATFRVRAVTRCSASIPGHAEAVLSVAFSPDGSRLASGSGDTTVRFWDITTQTPEFTCKGHTHWVNCIAWSSCGTRVASGGADNNVIIWDPATGEQIGPVLRGHRKWLTSLSWEPFHLADGVPRLASSSKDGTVRIWDTVRGVTCFSLAQHTDAVSCVRWGGEGLIYTASRDRTIKVWDAKDGKICRTLQGHGHWVNSLTLHTDYILRTGPFDHTGKRPASDAEAKAVALKRYQEVRGAGERMISGSDDFTLFLWDPSRERKPIARLTGHQQLVNHVVFSPDGRWIASASFDKSVKLWDGTNGKFVGNFRGHVQSVYQVAWSSDSRLLISASKDSTLKVWDVRTKKLRFELPGHADEVYAVDWSPDGNMVASGGKDKVLKLWRA